MTKKSNNNCKSPGDQNPHQGHRGRLRAQFLNNGVDSFYDHQLMELLLFYSIPREDTNGIAHLLLNHFGSISGVLDADYEDLLEIQGVGPNTALFLKLLPALFSRYMKSTLNRQKLETTADLCRYFLYKLMTVRNEQLWLTCLDDKFGVVSDIKISEGNGSSVLFDMNKITLVAAKIKCTNCVLAHNHPFGDSYPSDDDIKLTEAFRNTLDRSGIRLIDHIIVSRNEARSMFYDEAVVLESDQPDLADKTCNENS